MTIDTSLQENYIAFQQLPQQFKTLLMATTDEHGCPNASYAPYLTLAGDYYVLISDLSTHTSNLAINGLASVLFIENEADAGHLFARRRVTLKCEACEIARDSDLFQRAVEGLTRKFGEIISMLESKQDFHLYRLHPIKGGYVAGFGKAYLVDGENLSQIRHVNDQGHKSRVTA